MSSAKTFYQLQLAAWRDPVQRRRLLTLLLFSLVSFPVAYWLPSYLPPSVVLVGGVELPGSALVWGLRSFFLGLLSLYFTTAYLRTVLVSSWDRTLPFPVALVKGVATVPTIALFYELVQLFSLAFLGGLSQQYLFSIVGFFLWELLLAIQLLSFHLFHPEWGIPSFYTVYASGRASTAIKVAAIAASATAFATASHEFNEAYQRTADRQSNEALKKAQIESEERTVKVQSESQERIAKAQIESEERIRLAKIAAKKRSGWFW